MPARCDVCDLELSQERAMLIAGSNGALPCVCIEHSKVTKPKGFLNYGHKTAGEVIIIPNNPESLRKATREYRRAR